MPKTKKEDDAPKEEPPSEAANETPAVQTPNPISDPGQMEKKEK